MSFIPINFTPDLDNAWSVNPGALSRMDGYAPLLNGAYGSVSKTNTVFSLTGADHLSAYMFRQVNGSVRFLTFRKQNIDEYDSSGTRTNRGTGYSSSTTSWSAAAWGNQIIACNYLDATQSSTGAGFTALGGSSPKARYIAANLNFVMLADTDDGGSNIQQDRVWWCALQDPGVWTPSISTQAGTIRLLDAPGPLRQLVSYRDSFVAFKDNALWIGEYVGPPYVFAWRMISNRIGCIAPKSVVELDGKLYFLHTSGFYEFDGQNIKNVGYAVTQAFLADSGFVDSMYNGIPTLGATQQPVSSTMAVADDLEGIVWFANTYQLSGFMYSTFYYGYNVRNGKWGRYLNTTSTNLVAAPPTVVQATSADVQAFKSLPSARTVQIHNSDGVALTGSLNYAAYPGINTSATFTTGLVGDFNRSSLTTRLYPRMLAGSTALTTGDNAAVTGYTTENKLVTAAAATVVSPNTELQAWDLTMNARYREYAITTTSKQLVAGLAITSLDKR